MGWGVLMFDILFFFSGYRSMELCDSDDNLLVNLDFASVSR
jgi:hypothetical protein